MKSVIKCATAKSMWTDLVLSHEEPSDTRDTKIAAIRLRFNAFKALEGEKVNGTFTRMKCLLNDLENNGISISQAEDSDSNVEEDTRSSSEFFADLNVEFHDRALLTNQKRIYKRTRRVGSAKKILDKINETCFACGKLGKYKDLKAKIAILTKRIDIMFKGKSEKGLVAESFDWDEESVSSEDEGVNKVKAFMAIAEEEPSVGKRDARSGQWVKITMKKVQTLLSMTDGEERKHVLDYTHKPLPPFLKLTEVVPNGTSPELISMVDLTRSSCVSDKPKKVQKWFGDNSSGDTEGYGSVNCNGINFTKVAYVNVLKHNLISINLLCDANFKVLFTKTQGTILNQNNEVALITPRRRDDYVIDMSSYDEESNACFFPKASNNVNWLWHKRLSHLNFKNINKLARQNLVACLPSLTYSKDKTCLACEKRKHHRASFITKRSFSINK
nr:ribonuclease H-like domain-containing protein [Tanacetum cinerariifolium]